VNIFIFGIVANRLKCWLSEAIGRKVFILFITSSIQYNVNLKFF